MDRQPREPISHRLAKLHIIKLKDRIDYVNGKANANQEYLYGVEGIARLIHAQNQKTNKFPLQ